MKQKDIVERFCSPLQADETEFDQKAFSDAEKKEIIFEGTRLYIYSWGSGKNILIVHGWGSRASHLAFLGRNLAKNGFKVTLFDTPSHGKSLKSNGNNTSNLFEFSRAISFVAKSLLPIYAVIGHSLGATASAFILAGHERFSPYKISTEKLVLISPPSGVERMIEHFCRKHKEEGRFQELSYGLEKKFDFSVPDYELSDAIKNIQAKILILHDEDDDEIPVSDSLKLKEARQDAALILTKKAGHNLILLNRVMIRAVSEFLIT